MVWGTQLKSIFIYANNIKLRARVESINPFDQFYASVDNLETGLGSIKVNDFSGAGAGYPLTSG